MARKKGDLNRTTKDINEAVKKHFAYTNKDGKYLDDLARDDKNLYIALVLKVMPNQIAVDVKHHIDLAGAMLVSQQQLQTSQANNEIKTIEHLTPVTLSPDNETLVKEITAKSLKTKDNEQ